jgi:hypothetical protein
MAMPANMPNMRWATANTHGVKSRAAVASTARQIPYCITTAHSAAVNSIPAAITSERLAGSRTAAATPGQASLLR